MFLATVFFMVVKIGVKLLPNIPPMEIVFFRCLISFLITYFLLKRKNVSILGNNRNLLFYYRLLKDNRFLFGARGDLVGSEESSLIKSKKMEQQMKKVFPEWKNVEIDYHWRGLVAVTTKFTPSIGKLDDDEIYYSFGYQANGVNTAPWSGSKLANLIVSNSKELNISKFYQGLPKKFPFPKLRLFYLKMYLAYHSLRDK